MWHLTSESDPRIIYIVPLCSEIIIGRNSDAQICNFVILDDPSISRKHATLTIVDNNLFLFDFGSRYGTFINDSTEKVEINTNLKLNHNDVVKFGKLNSIWKVHHMDIITCTSTLKGESLQNLKLILSKIGGMVSNDWNDDCKYITMPTITLTIKVVLGLVHGSYIVTVEYWNKCLEAITNHTTLPDPQTCIPEVVESTLNKEVVSFLPNMQRKSLFDGKKFIFFSKRQFEMYKTILLKGSALPLLLSESKMTKSMLCNEDIIVIQYIFNTTSQETQAQRNQISEIITYLKNKGKRVVADAEIGLAILYCSIDKYCNPSFNFSTEVIKQNSGLTKTTKILAQESQEPTPQIKKENVVINESLISNDNINVSSTSVGKITMNKRKLSGENDDIPTNIAKKLNTNNINSPDKDKTVKRKFEDCDGSFINTTKKRIALDNDFVDSDKVFDFCNTNDNENRGTEKKLNLSKPLKRKADLISSGDDSLFNFVETNDEQKSGKSIKTNILFDKSMKEDNINTVNNEVEKHINITAQDISAMRGVKLEELKMSNMNWNSSSIKHNIKKENNDELDQKMSNLDLGCTIVTIRKDLIVKKEPLQIEAQNAETKNFKKFKKVWPVKMQVTVVPRSSISLAQTCT